jgi:hypothetical protein
LVGETPAISNQKKACCGPVVWSPHLGGDFLNFSLKIGLRAFEQSTVTRILAVFDLPKNVLKREPQIFLFAKPGRGFPCQARLLDGCAGGGFVLLGFDRLAFPTPCHGGIITLPARF